MLLDPALFARDVRYEKCFRFVTPFFVFMLPEFPLLLATLSPLSIVAFSVLLIGLTIGVLRLHPFLALMGAAVFVGLLTASGSLGEQRYARAVEKVMTEFGATAGRIGFAIAVAAIIGMALIESGAADRIVRRMIAVLGEQRAGIGLLVCSFVLAAPVFVDTVFMLLLPLARVLSLRTGRNLLLYVLVIGLGAAIGNGVVPPAPGPMLVAEALKIELGHAILAGVTFAVLPGIGAYFIAQWFNRRFTVPFRPVAGESAALVDVAEDQLPPFLLSILPILLPLVLIATAACVGLAHAHLPPAVIEGVQFLGNKNVALSLGAAIALAVLIRQKRLPWRQAGKSVVPALEAAGLIILIVGAGGAYGAMIKAAGVGDQVRDLAEGRVYNPVLLAWGIAALIRGALGSATVATITGVGIMASVAGTAGYGVHPIYIFLAIGFGAKCLPWMNDAAFWVVSRLGGLTQGEMLRTWSPASTAVSMLGLLEVWIASTFWPQLPF